MVRSYKRKTPGPVYTKEDLADAMKLINDEKWSFRKASARFNIPLSTLSLHISRSVKPNVGRPPALTRDEEQYLVKLIVTLQEWGQLSTCADVLRYTTEYVDIMGLKSLFINDQPTKDWYYSFLKRWAADLKLMHCNSLENNRAQAVTQEIIEGWFGKLNKVLTKLDLFDKPQNIFNMDESGFCDEPGRRVVVVKRGTKYAEQVRSGSGKGCTTVLLTIAANGSCLPPYIIYKSLRLYSQWCPKNIIRGAVFNGTRSGWSDEDCFFDYFQKLFVLNTKHLKKPLLLIFDGHYSHLSIKTVRLAIENDIHLLCLPSHATHILQPLDIYILKYVKQQWKELLWERNKRTTKAMDKQDFVILFSKLYNYALIPAHCSTAFAKADICPYDKRAIKNHRIIRNTLSATETSPPQTWHAAPVQLNASINSNDTIINQRKPLTRSTSAPDFTNNSSTSTTIHSNGFNDTRLDGTLPIDRTALAYALLDDALQKSIIEEPTTSNSNKPSTITKTTSPVGNISSTSSNASSDTSQSSVVPTDTDSTKSLSAAEAIVAKYLTPKSSLTKTTKRLIKRPHGVSVTDLDILGENIVKKKKKDDKVKKLKTSSKSTTSSAQSTAYSSQLHHPYPARSYNPYQSQSSNHYPPQSQVSYPNIRDIGCPATY